MGARIDEEELIELCSIYRERVRHWHALARQYEHASTTPIEVQERLDSEMYGAELVRLEIAGTRARSIAGIRAKGSAHLAFFEGEYFPAGFELIESLLRDLLDTAQYDPADKATVARRADKAALVVARATQH